MPISEQSRINSYTGNGSTTVFAYTFKIFAEADLTVKVDSITKTLTTDYTVSGVGASGGGSVTFLTAPASGALVNISGEMTYKRDTDYVDNGDLKAQTLDDDLDRIVILEQQLRRDVKRSIKLPIEETDDKGITTVPASRANKVLAFDAAGAPAAKAIGDLSTTVTAVDASLVLSGGNMGVAKPFLSATGGGTVDAITATVSPAPSSLVNGLTVLIRAAGANASTTPTFNMNGLGAKTIVKGSNTALLAGDIPGAGFWMELVYDSTLDKWVVNNPSNAITLVEHNPNGTHIRPYFSAQRNGVNQTGLPAASWTQILCNYEEYDSHGYYNSTTCIFTPLIAGMYKYTGQVYFLLGGAGKTFQAGIYKNGVAYRASSITSGGTAGVDVTPPPITVEIYMNGSTDNVGFYAYNGDVATRDVYGSTAFTFFSGCKIS